MSRNERKVRADECQVTEKYTMNLRFIRWILVPVIFLYHGCESSGSETFGFHKEVGNTLEILVGALKALQITDHHDPDFGAIRCPGCNVLHTRAAEAVYPFAVWSEISKNESYVQSAVDLGNWLIRQQQKDGSWKETPEAWTGTTTDQLLMISGAYPILESHLTAAERNRWQQ